jgi:hypothetical protein
MHEWIDAALIVLLLTNLLLLGHSRLGACIRMVAIQGVVLGFLILGSHAGELAPRIWALAAATVALKGGVFPWSWRGRFEARASGAKSNRLSATFPRSSQAWRFWDCRSGLGRAWPCRGAAEPYRRSRSPSRSSQCSRASCF